MTYNLRSSRSLKAACYSLRARNGVTASKSGTSDKHPRHRRSSRSGRKSEPGSPKKSGYKSKSVNLKRLKRMCQSIIPEKEKPLQLIRHRNYLRVHNPYPFLALAHFNSVNNLDYELERCNCMAVTGYPQGTGMMVRVNFRAGPKTCDGSSSSRMQRFFARIHKLFPDKSHVSDCFVAGPNDTGSVKDLYVGCRVCEPETPLWKK